MNIIKKEFPPKEVRMMMKVIDELSLEFDSEAYRLVRGLIEKGILSDYKNVVSQATNEKSAREIAYVLIANISGDLVESGNYHIYRGVLNPLSIGNELLQLFDTATDRLLEEGAISEEEAEEQKSGIRENIKSVG